MYCFSEKRAGEVSPLAPRPPSLKDEAQGRHSAEQLSKLWKLLAAQTCLKHTTEKFWSNDHFYLRELATLGRTSARFSKGVR